jgi:prolyl-tRNA editing enzyme YbaK/EbsC (Cys-tRNA(Pro) deacylase)
MWSGEELGEEEIPGRRWSIRTAHIQFEVLPDCELGAEPPFGPLYGVPMVVDLALQSEEITFNAGNHMETLTMSLGDYLELTKPRRVDLTAT